MEQNILVGISDFREIRENDADFCEYRNKNGSYR